MTKAAVRALRKLDVQTRERIDTAIEALAEEPRPTGCVKMSGRDTTWRIRVGDYRVVY
ncbi:MAG: type II toxin-antitoxin system RelE/ParE family toxin [Planctomycetota bacterium]